MTNQPLFSVLIAQKGKKKQIDNNEYATKKIRHIHSDGRRIR